MPYDKDGNWIPEWKTRKDHTGFGVIMKLLLALAVVVLLATSCASTNYYGPRGLSSAQYETYGYVVITNWYGSTIFSGECAYYWDEGDLIIGGKRYAGNKYRFSFGL